MNVNAVDVNTASQEWIRTPFSRAICGKMPEIIYAKVHSVKKGESTLFTKNVEIVRMANGLNRLRREGEFYTRRN